LHIKATDTGGPAGFLGDFTLSSIDHVFSNGSTSLTTNTANWMVSKTGWNNYQTPSSYGVNGVGPWGTKSGVSANAQWIWSADNYADNLNYFSTKISAVNSCSAAGTLNAVGIKIGSGGSDTQVNTTTEAQTILAQWQAAGSPATGLINNGMYNVTASGASTVDRIDFGGSNHDFSGTLPYPGASAGVGGEHFVVQASGTISLPAGDYTIYVEGDDGISFTLNTISGDAVVFNKFGSSTSGASNELRFENPTANSNTGGSFTLTQDSVFSVSAIFFERTGGDYFEISIANNIRNNAAPSGYEVLRNGALNGKVKFGCVTVPVIDHYEIIHDGNGLTCEPEIVSIKACTNAYGTACALSTDPVTIDVLATGSTAVTSSVSFTGSTTASIPYTLAETVTLSLSNPSITAANPTVCINGNTNSCNMVFADAGFRFLSGPTNSAIIANQTSGSAFSEALKLQAVKNSSGVCTGLFTGNKTIELSQENVSPTGISGLSFTVNGNTIAKHSSTTPTILNFGADSIATIPTPIYQDAGEIRLHANYNVGGVSLTGSSNPFWVSPASLVLSAKSGATNLNGATAASTITHKAGDNFDFTVSAYNSLGVITPNYSPGQIQLKVARTGPTLAESVDGYFTYAQDSTVLTSTNPIFQNALLNNFVSGTSIYNAAQYSEVGLINVEVQDSNYGNVGIVIPSTAIDIGRFTPDHFNQTVATNGSLLATCNSGTTFAYSGQKDQTTDSIGAISYLTNPVLEITAYNKQGDITQNYYEDSQGSANDYMKLSANNINITSPTLDQTALGVDGTNLSLTANMFTGTFSQNDLTTLPNIEPLPHGVMHYRLSDTDNFFYNRSANALVAPFTSNIAFYTASITDSDAVNLATKIDANPTGVEIRFGRLVLENSFGPETSNIPQPMQIEHFDGTSFVVSSNNNCVNYDASKVSLTNISLNPTLTNVLGGTGAFMSGKTQAIELQATGAGNTGNIGVTYNAPSWLKFDWNGDGVYDNNPASVATFGLFRGNDRIIYWREIAN
jgi:MSHA biogenesis protein MshQ